jgi:RimJ/RimL family protein N-acetyltransferase
MFEFGDIRFKKLERGQLSTLQGLKNESFGTTHHTSIVNSDDQDRWFDSLDKHVHQPTNLCLVAQGKKVDDDQEWWPTIGIFKISSVDWVSRSADTAWDVFAAYRGQGFGKKLVFAGVSFCFRTLNLRRLNCEILEYNGASLECAKAAGFVQEGRKRESIFKDQKYHDSLVLGVLDRHFPPKSD